MLEQEYQKAYEQLEEIARKREAEKRFMALGYTSNLDLLCDFDVEQLNRLLETHMPEADLKEMKAAECIRTMEDLLSTMVYYCLQGIGGEVDVENTELVEKSFRFSYGMGGTGVQAAMALAQVGCPSLVHLTDDSPEVCRILDLAPIHTISPDGKLVHTGEISRTQDQEIHFIVQFQKGGKIRLGGQEETIPCSNRLILTKITVNEFVPFSKPFFEWIEQHAKQVSSIVLSSFNCILDQNVLKERLDAARSHLEAYRRNNPDGIAYFEDAHYHDLSVKKLCIETLYSQVDIVSMNEEELLGTLRDMYQYEVDLDDIISCIKGAEYIRQQFGVGKGVVVHTKDYSMYVGDKLDADIRGGLIYGNLLATAKAANGWYGTMEQIGEVMEYGFSEKGIQSYQTVCSSEYASRAVLVPSKYMDRPRYTIGLGDSFIGGVQICFGNQSSAE